MINLQRQVLNLPKRRIQKDRNVESFQVYINELVEHKGVEFYSDLDAEQKKTASGLYLRDIVGHYDQHTEIVDSDYGHSYPKFFADVMLGNVDITGFFKTIENNFISYFEDRIENAIREKVGLYNFNQRWNNFDDNKESYNA